MHLLYASHRYHPIPGGTERIAQLLAEAAVRAGHRATMITQVEPGTAPRETVNGVEVVRLPMRPIAGVRVPQGYLRLLRRTRAEVFHVQGNRIWCADFYFPVANLFPWRQLVTGHGFYQYAMHPKAWDRWYFERYFPRILGPFDRYVCDTEYERQQLLGWGVPPERLARIPLGADIDEFRHASVDPRRVREEWGIQAPHVAVYVGGFFENKRVDRLIEAIGRRAGAWALVVVGRDLPGAPFDRAHCEALARRLGVELHVAGVLDRPATVAAFLAADAVVSGSEYEGFGVALAEAMAAGKPFVAWASGAAPEMAATGAGVAVRSIDAFAEGLEQLESASERVARGARARAAAEEWSTAAMCRRYLELYRALEARGDRRAGRRGP